MQAAVSVRLINGRWANAILTDDRAEGSDADFFGMDPDTFNELTESGNKAFPVVVAEGRRYMPADVSVVHVIAGCPVELADLANRAGYSVVGHRSHHFQAFSEVIASLLPRRVGVYDSVIYQQLTFCESREVTSDGSR